ncbi:MAG: hypothetical protein WD250_13770 [Egibacteraceae bacterium]
MAGFDTAFGACRAWLVAHHERFEEQPCGVEIGQQSGGVDADSGGGDGRVDEVAVRRRAKVAPP